MILLRKFYIRMTNLSWLVLTLSTFLLIAISSIALPIIEPQTFANIYDSLWFTMTTILTVGYGDISPATLGGRLFTVLFLYLFGIGLFATFVGKLMDSLTIYRKRKESGEMMYEGMNHIIVIDWSHKAENAIKEIMKRDKKIEIVVIDNLEKAKELSERIHYVKGNATDSEVLQRANIKNAKSIIIFADDRIQDQILTDGKSLMIACAIDRICPNIHTTVEIEREEHIENFSHMEVDNFILSNGTIAKLAVDSVFN